MPGPRKVAAPKKEEKEAAGDVKVEKKVSGMLTRAMAKLLGTKVPEVPLFDEKKNNKKEKEKEEVVVEKEEPKKKAAAANSEKRPDPVVANAEAAKATAAGGGVIVDRVRALCLGSSQMEFEEKKVPVRRGVVPQGRKGPNALAGINDDVENFRKLLKKHWYAEQDNPQLKKSESKPQKFVGHDGSGFMTRNRFLGAVRSQLLLPTPSNGPHFYALYVLYYAGHGGRDGHFALEKDGKVTLEDILAVWAESEPCKAGASKLLIVADSCHSGAMAARLRSICEKKVKTTRIAQAAPSVAIQTACGPKEVAYDNVFIHAYLKYADEHVRILTRNLFESEFSPLCGVCRNYYRSSCQGCKQVVKAAAAVGHKPPPRNPDEMQHAEFYCPWGATQLSTGPKGKPFLLYEQK